MGFMDVGGGFHDGNASHSCNQKHTSYPSHIFSENTNWQTASVHTSVTKEAIRKATGRVNDPLEFLVCTNSPRYHANRFHTYRNFTNNMDPGMVECEKRSIQEYTQHNSAMLGRRGSKGIQYGKGQTSSTKMRSMFAECRAQP